MAGLAKLSSRRRDVLASPYTLTLGDEFQALYSTVQGVAADLIQLILLARPARIRIALGWGRIETRINRKQALGMDGPAFHAARDGMNALRRDGGWLHGSGGFPFNSPLWPPLCRLFAAEVDSWNTNRLTIFRAC